MLKIFSNVDKLPVFQSFSVGQSFPEVKGKLIRIEINGKELAKLMEVKEIPICDSEYAYLVWDGKSAGSILKLLREIFIR